MVKEKLSVLLVMMILPACLSAQTVDGCLSEAYFEYGCSELRLLAMPGG